MTWQHIEKIFNRAMQHAFSRRKWLLVFPVLALGGLFAVICRAISHGASQWMQMSLAFLPLFLCAGLLLGVGIILTRIYYNEVKGQDVSYLKMIRSSSNLFYGVAYLALPLIFSYLVLWMILGIFYLLRAIPSIGPFMSSILAFGPFLLVLGSLVLAFVNLLMLFFIAPAASIKTDLGPKLAEEVYQEIKANPFLSFVLPIIGLIPLGLVVGTLSLAAVVTQIIYIESATGAAIALKWFFMMVPFCALLTPAVIFFFNFSLESYVLIRKSLAKD